MPDIYQAKCDHCSYTSELFPSGYGAVYLDEPPVGDSMPVAAGAVLHDDVGEADIVEQSDPRLVVLMHPIEHSILSNAGYNWISLALAGRYVRVSQVLCIKCGTPSEVCRLTWPPAVAYLGCLPSFVLMFTAMIVWRLGIWAAYGLALAMFASLWLAGCVYTRLRFRKRARDIEVCWSCSRCGANRYARVKKSRNLFPCPQCSEQSLQIHSVGFS